MCLFWWLLLLLNLVCHSCLVTLVVVPSIVDHKMFYDCWCWRLSWNLKGAILLCSMKKSLSSDVCCFKMQTDFFLRRSFYCFFKILMVRAWTALLNINSFEMGLFQA
ncbi:hypothetical protein HanRHA438_Chr11g0484531 [Helianthus annuus]|uniref:Secreted protein n=1 Tax=Helianthus annuus TaxID=4232 RepID=A0A9K3MYI3_HELAN|nr:hypothetical protein HanXRQr2_Chr11g0471051 [Helianthus annuus]KAJ0516021.1 hypothetical protein HanHA89_Chr11g0409201 [Helianthus annuus]KAJ0869017.1 hypothetical protein HanRHA438_Chr11g0484531 [Helianthus annuus]